MRQRLQAGQSDWALAVGGQHRGGGQRVPSDRVDAVRIARQSPFAGPHLDAEPGQFPIGLRRHRGAMPSQL